MRCRPREQGGQIDRVFLGTALAWGLLALAVAPAVVDKDAAAFREGGDDEMPNGVVAPRAMDEHEGRAGLASEFIE
jgi:hypothetical protein